eukprot:g14817.t1
MGSRVNVEDSQVSSLLTVFHCIATSAGSVLPVGQDIFSNDDDGVWDIVRSMPGDPFGFISLRLCSDWYNLNGLLDHFREQLRVNHIAMGLESHVGQT